MTAARFEFGKPDDYEKFGNLVKKWASRLPLPPEQMMPRQDFQKLLNDAGVDSTVVPPEITNVQFLTWTSDPSVLVVLVPPAKAIKDADDVMRGQGPYHLPVFYRSVFVGNNPNVDLEKFNAQRIGEYCINQCQ